MDVEVHPNAPELDWWAPLEKKEGEGGLGRNFIKNKLILETTMDVTISHISHIRTVKKETPKPIQI